MTEKALSLQDMIDQEKKGYPEDTAQARHDRLVAMIEMLSNRLPEPRAKKAP